MQAGQTENMTVVSMKLYPDTIPLHWHDLRATCCVKISTCQHYRSPVQQTYACIIYLKMPTLCILTLGALLLGCDFANAKNSLWNTLSIDNEDEYVSNLEPNLPTSLDKSDDYEDDDFYWYLLHTQTEYMDDDDNDDWLDDDWLSDYWKYLSDYFEKRSKLDNNPNDNGVHDDFYDDEQVDDDVFFYFYQPQLENIEDSSEYGYPDDNTELLGGKEGSHDGLSESKHGDITPTITYWQWKENVNNAKAGANLDDSTKSQRHLRGAPKRLE